ncbi:MAG: alpha/beta fold hydrolase [Leptolyngbyaceae cyanobacterium bins.349]|nr:alpha/beta fold hydrolase [Leptolyngbyaceae cyanobacterium bins.349]
MIKRLYQFALAATAIAIAPFLQPSSTFAKPTTPYRNTQIPCPTAIAPEEIDGKTTICGVVTVPEDYSKPNGRQIEITYALLKSKSLSPQPDPLIALHGGPGGSDISAIPYFTMLYSQQRQNRDVILFDQRGSRYSGALLCSPTANILETVIKAPGNAWGKKYAALAKRLQGKSDLDGETLALFALCPSVLSAHGFDLNQYNTANNARDVISLASALGYDKVNLYGISYGTYLALRVMRDYPQHLRSVVLDSTIPPNVLKYETSLGIFETPALNLIEDCQKDAACDRAYPNLKQRMASLLKRLDQQPIPLSKADAELVKSSSGKVDVDAIAELFNLINVDGRVRIAQYVPLIVSELERGVTTTYVGVVSGKIFPTPAQKTMPLGDPQGLLAKAEEMRAKARQLLTERITLAENRRPSQQWVQQVLNAIETLPEADRVLARGNFYGVGFLQGQPRDRDTLAAIINEILPANQRQPLIQSLNTLSPAEIRHTYEVILGILNKAVTWEQGVSQGAFRSIDCQDLVTGSDPTRLQALLKQMTLPELGQSALNAGKQAYAICRNWGVKPAPDSDRAAVKSKIPTLVLQSRYDTQTTTTMGRPSTVGLENGIFLEFPNGGHGVLQFSQCARDVGVAFVNNPTRPPAAECRASLKPKFVLPTPP